MTIQEKTKAYDEAIERARKELQTCGSVNCDAAKQIFRLFPELKESEDERIRKELIGFVKSRLAGFPECDRFIAWLEKQDTFSKKDVDNAYLKGIIDAKNEIEKRYEIIFPKLKESEDELTWLTRYIEEEVYSLSMDIRDDEDRIKLKNLKKSLDWLEKQGEQNPYSGVSFKYNGHTFTICAKDGGAEILMDGNLKAFISLDKSFVYPINSTPLLDSKNFQISTVDGLIHDNPTDKIELKEK